MHRAKENQTSLIKCSDRTHLLTTAATDYSLQTHTHCEAMLSVLNVTCGGLPFNPNPKPQP